MADGAGHAGDRCPGSQLLGNGANARREVAHRGVCRCLRRGIFHRRTRGLIDRAVRLLRESGADSVQSYERPGKYHPYWMVRLGERGEVTPWQPNTIYRRQDLPPAFMPDGGVIAVTRASLETVIEGEPHAFLGLDRRGIENPQGSVIDIDHPVDFLVAEALLRERYAAAGGKNHT